MIFQHALQFAKTKLSKNRLEHSIGVAKCGFRLALKYGVNPERAYLAGLLHDIARDFPLEMLLLKAKKEDIIRRKEEIVCPVLLHGKISAVIARKELGIKDEGVLSAIAYHVSGRRHWTKLEQIVYLADKIEPGRNYPKVNVVRNLLEVGEFDEALLESLRNAIIYAARTRGWIVDPETVVIFNEMVQTQR